MTADNIRAKFLKFFESRGHKLISPASLVPADDPSVLFTTAGMQQFKPYYVGVKDAAADFNSTNVTSVQKCVRTSDIDEVGDERHLTFFEMLGNFSFGGYFKEEAIKLAHEFITQEMGLKVDYVSVFEGEDGIPADAESEQIWRQLDPNITIKKFGRADNFWGPTGEEGPCGPTTEVYVDGIEVWNIVFNQFYCEQDKTLKPLKVKGIDTGMGLERLALVSQFPAQTGEKTIFETDLFKPLMKQLGGLAKNYETKSARIVADHARAAAFLISDGVTPSNTDRGYILRRLIRRAVRHADILSLPENSLSNLIGTVSEIYDGIYPEIKSQSSKIKNEIQKEENKFRETLVKGLKEFNKEADPFILFTTYGFPLELIKELAEEKGVKMDEEKFWQDMKDHQKLSRAGAEQKFKGGLADISDEQVIKYHTTTHLLNQALREVLGEEVEQRGSNITAERLRFDFSHPTKVTEEEKKKIEEIVNEKIKEDLPVKMVILPKAEAEQTGARHMFNEKYGDEVKVYYIGHSLETAFSKEFCGGPHVARTGELGTFKITKEEAVAAGIRRIKAILR